MSPKARKATEGGFIGAAIGAVTFFLLCFQLIPEGEGQLGCLVFPFLGIAVGGGAGALIGWLTSRRERG